MTTPEAKKILLGWRTEDGRDAPEIAAALEQALRDPELRQWLAQQQAFHDGMRGSLRDIPVPTGLHDRILAQRKIIRVSWRRPAWAIAAAIALLLGGTFLWVRPGSEDSFDTFRSRMVRTVLRQYAMDLHTNDMARIREFLDTNQAPSNYEIPEQVAALPASGAGVLSWQGRRVSMVCLDAGSEGTVFLFVADRAGVKYPPAKPERTPVSSLMTASWTRDGLAYVLAANPGATFWQRFPQAHQFP